MKRHSRVSPDCLDMEGICPPYGRQSVNGGGGGGETHEEGHRPYRGDLTLKDYIMN